MDNQVKKNWSLKKVGLLLLGIYGGAFILNGIFSDSDKEPTQNKEIVANVQNSRQEEVPPQMQNQEEQTAVDEAEQEITSAQMFKVVNVVDGDTIDVMIDGKKERLRLIGMDTPETVDPRKPVQCFGKEASKKAKELLLGQAVSLEVDSSQDERDKYDRLLRYVFLEDGTNFNELMIQEGYAHEYTYSVPYKYQKEFKEAEREAREGKKGLWGDVCVEKEAEVAPVVMPAPVEQKSTGSYICNCSKTCANMSSCAEAQYQLNVCGCSRRDGDKDGIACDTDCQ